MNTKITNTVHPLDPNEAAEWTANWRAAAQAFNVDLQGFTVDVSEILELLGIPQSPVTLVQKLRFYLALNSKDHNYPKGFHLIFCAVDSSTNNDIVCPIKPGYGAVYDLTNPCPPTCGAPSCLNSDVPCGCK
jgi:hypothetical protein